MGSAAVDRRLGGRLALVLGGGAQGTPAPGEPWTLGNGRAIAIRMAAEGARVVVGDVSRRAAEETVEMIRAAGESAAVVEIDAEDPASCRDGVARAAAILGGLDVVVCNVGVHGRLTFSQQDVEDWDRTFDINVRGQLVTAQAALEVMLPAGHGAFVFVSSIAAERSSLTGVAYEASKAAQLALMRHIAVRYAGKGIRANAVALGIIDTGMVRELFSATPDAVAARELVIPMRRQGRPEEVAAATAFLASEDASYITGAVIHVDGGLTAASASRVRGMAGSGPVPALETGV